MKLKVYASYILVFLVLGLFALNFNFIEGDDATTVMYHLMGRNVEIQTPYAAYHSMFDAFLSFFDSNNEWLLRHVAIGMSFIFGLLMLLSLAYLIFLKSKQSTKNIGFVLLALPFLIPEILFNSLILNPTLISFTFILLSHILLIKYLKNNHIYSLIAAILCFGIGVSFRWSNGFYLFVLFGDFILTDASKIKDLISIKRIKKSLIIFPFFILAVVLCIHLSGYSLLDIYSTYAGGTQYVEEMEVSYTSMFASGVTFLTPAFLLLFFLGLFYCFRTKKYRNVFLLLFTLLPYFVVGLYPSYKYMISGMFVFALLCIQGVSLIEKKWFKITLVILIGLPWLLGVQIKTTSAWGPGFEVTSKDIQTKNDLDFNPDNSVTIEKPKVVLGSGMALPTPEGPRSLYGFGSVFMKDWKLFIDENNEEREASVDYAIKNNAMILQDVRHLIVASKLVEQGFKTEQSFVMKDDKIYEREFFNRSDTVVIKVFKNKRELFKQENLEDLLLKSPQIVIYASYSNIISKLNTNYKERFVQKGPYWGILKTK